MDDSRVLHYLSEIVGLLAIMTHDQNARPPLTEPEIKTMERAKEAMLDIRRRVYEARHE